MENGITTKWEKVRALSWSERRVLVAAAAWLPLFWLALRLFGLRRIQAWLQRDKVAAIPSSLALDEVARIGTLVNRAALHAPFPATCLTRSLLLRWMLRRRGVASRLRIGVRLNAGALDAHAWVEFTGIPINDRPEVCKEFAPFAELLPAEAFHSP